MTDPAPGTAPSITSQAGTGGGDFLSDNSAGLCPEALQALVDNAGGRAAAYGDDDATEQAVTALRGLFGDSAEVFFVATGTAANTLSLASLTQRWQRVLCEDWAHLNNDESTAPELVTGCRITPIAAGGRKLTPDDVAAADDRLPRGVHHPMPGVVTITNVTEHGEVYTPGEVAAIAAVAHERGYRVHMDGARFANAVAALGCEPRALVTDAGVDALSFGGAKNGLALGEAVVFLGDHAPAAAARFPYLRKGSGHLLSKLRYVSAPFAATLAGGAWLRHAAHANEMAARMVEGLDGLGHEPRFPADANMVFVSLSGGVHDHLRARGWGYLEVGDPAWRMARFVTAFDTPAARVDALLADLAAA